MEINGVLRSHQLEHSEVLALFHNYLPVLIERFYGGCLPLPALSWEHRGYRNLGTYRQEDGLALCHRINLNSVYAERPLAEHLATLTHELGHEWQCLHGKPSDPPYHNKEFQAKMAEIGIPCDSRGCSLGMHEPFLSFLNELGVEAQVLPFKQDQRVRTNRPGSRLKPWQCKCTRVWASIRVEVKATCSKCDHTFQRQ